MSRLLRFWIGTLTCFALVGIAISILTSEITFQLKSVSSTAAVERYTPNKIFAKFGFTLIGRGGGTATHLVGGQPVKATFRSWYFQRGPEVAERFPILYLPTDPRFVKVDSSMQRFGPIVFPLALALAAAFWSGILRFPSGPVKDVDEQSDPPKSPVGREFES